ncbi:MAG: hypothetical protein Q7O66_02325 [Dehalococcoidia bacterium]|nr:hypothetical protein [Dehalococcoidia bacterium]
MLASDRVEVSEAIEAMFQEFYERGWTDGLPVIPPTEERVQVFVDYLGRDAGEIVAEIPPENGVATIEKVAINAVMAGCLPEYMPVILAAIDAVVEPDWGLWSIQVTTNSASPFVIVNGPIRNELKINCGANAMGQGWRANATIGRAVNLLLRNAGGATPGLVSKSTQGMPGRFTMCIGENEEDSPWEPLHVERGFSPQQSTVTVLPAASTLQLYAGSRGADRCLTIIAHSITAMGTNNMIARRAKPDAPVLIMCPAHAQMCADAGYSKQDVKRILWERGRLPIDWFPEDVAAEKYTLGLVFDGMVPLLGQPDELVITVAGGPSGLHTTFVPSMGVGHPAITKLINVPAR